MIKYKLCTVYHLDTKYESKFKPYYFKTKDKLHENDIVLCHTQYGLLVGKVLQPNITLDYLIENKYGVVSFDTLRECEKYPSLNVIRKKKQEKDNFDLPF